jgi:hypothetical protein
MGRALADTAPAVPPVQAADLAAGAPGGVVEILATLLEISMTHGSHRLVSHRPASRVRELAS